MGLQTSPGEDLGDVSPSLRRKEGGLQGGCEAQGGSRNRAARGEGGRELLSGFHCRQPQGLGAGGRRDPGREELQRPGLGVGTGTLQDGGWHLRGVAPIGWHPAVHPLPRSPPSPMFRAGRSAGKGWGATPKSPLPAAITIKASNLARLAGAGTHAGLNSVALKSSSGIQNMN